MYSIVYTEEAKKHIAFLRRNEPAAFKKVTQLLLELCDHPTTSSGHPEQMKGGQGER